MQLWQGAHLAGIVPESDGLLHQAQRLQLCQGTQLVGIVPESDESGVQSWPPGSCVRQRPALVGIVPESDGLSFQVQRLQLCKAPNSVGIVPESDGLSSRCNVAAV